MTGPILLAPLTLDLLQVIDVTVVIERFSRPVFSIDHASDEGVTKVIFHDLSPYHESTTWPATVDVTGHASGIEPAGRYVPWRPDVLGQGCQIRSLPGTPRAPGLTRTGSRPS